MIITCPSCKRRFELRRKAPSMFVCPKCNYRAPFQTVVNESSDEAVDIPPVFDATTANPNSNMNVDPNQETKVYVGKDAVSSQEKTKMVVTCGHLHVLSNNCVVKDIPLKLGMLTLGRMSTDSQASIKIAPDPYMSRIHAKMNVVLSQDGRINYIISPVKQTSPIYLDNNQIPFGKSAILRNGCKIRMGETDMVFVIR